MPNGGRLPGGSGGARADQLRAIFADRAPYRYVVVGGDLNDSSIGRVAMDAGYEWPTREGPRTTRFGRWDHVFLKGLARPDSAGSGTLADARGVSDHRAVWTLAIPR